MREQRRHRRIYMNCKIQISHPEFGSRLVEMRDFSDSGVFVSMDADQLPDIGTIVKGQVQGMEGDAPILDMEVVRSEHGGVGLRFCEDPDTLH